MDEFTGRLRHLVYRCEKCKRVLTKLEILARWEAAEKNKTPLHGACPCGGGRLSPTNLSIWEELTMPRVWVLWWKEVLWK
jgi:hypothetical protein